MKIKQSEHQQWCNHALPLPLPPPPPTHKKTTKHTRGGGVFTPGTAGAQLKAAGCCSSPAVQRLAD